MTLPIKCCEAERKFSKLYIYIYKKKKLEESLNCLSVLYTENYISKLLPYEEAIRGYAAKKCMK